VNLASPRREPAESLRRYPQPGYRPFRRAGLASIAHARRYYCPNEARILGLYPAFRVIRGFWRDAVGEVAGQRAGVW